MHLASADGAPKQGAPAVGDILDASGDVYRGDHRRHSVASRRHGSHPVHVHRRPTAATCATEVAIGGSLILVRTTGEDEGFTAWYGTGDFKGISGSGTSHNLGQTNNSDVVLRYKLG